MLGGGVMSDEDALKLKAMGGEIRLQDTPPQQIVSTAAMVAERGPR